MSSDFYKLLSKRVKALGGANSISGCSEAEIVALEAKFGIRLPKAYRQYLICFGKRAGALFTGTNCFFEDLANLRSSAEELLLENKTAFRLPVDAFVFSMHQGYEFTYFRATDGEDPPVWIYVEGEPPPSQPCWPSFSAFLAGEIERHEKEVRRTNQTKEKN